MKNCAPAGLAFLALAACTPAQDAPKPAAAVGLANPASVYCGEQGGRLVEVKTAAGVANDCLLPSGERIDEWALYRRDHSS